MSALLFNSTYLQYSNHFAISLRFSDTLVQNCATASADKVSKTIAEHSMILESDQRIAVLPALADILGATVLAFGDGIFRGHSFYFSLDFIFGNPNKYHTSRDKSRERMAPAKE